MAVKAWKSAPDAEKAEKANAVLSALGTYRVLCVTRHGPQGTEAVNRAAAERLFPARGERENYDGRVVMILKNNQVNGVMSANRQ